MGPDVSLSYDYVTRVHLSLLCIESKHASHFCQTDRVSNKRCLKIRVESGKSRRIAKGERSIGQLSRMGEEFLRHSINTAQSVDRSGYRHIGRLPCGTYVRSYLRLACEPTHGSFPQSRTPRSDSALSVLTSVPASSNS